MTTVEKNKLYRNYGYDIVINTLEPALRAFVAEAILLPEYGNDWAQHVPRGILDDLAEIRGGELPEDLAPEDFLEECFFLHLKDLVIFGDHFGLAQRFLGDVSKDKFIETMDELNLLRRKIAHARSTFCELDFLRVLEDVRMLSQGEAAGGFRRYVDNEEYKNAKEVPADFFEEYDCQNNLPIEDYDLDGGFVGRDKEIRAIRRLLTSEQDRIITVSGAGGVGKTAIALKVAYSFLADTHNPFVAVVWFSAKESRLTDEGIVPLVPGIRSDEQLVADILAIIDPRALETFRSGKAPAQAYKNHLFEILASQKCLLIIDNLETILKDEPLIALIKDIPRPSQVLITSRKGLGEIERRFPVADMPMNDAVRLFRIVAKQRSKEDLVRLKTESIEGLVSRVRCYPLLIKWSIGQVCLGKGVDDAFSSITSGQSEIAQFTFNDVFSLLSESAKTVLFGIVILGGKPASRYVLMHLANMADDQFEDAMRDLVITSFVFSQTRETTSGLLTEYQMLSLTQGFVEMKLDENEPIRKMLQTRHYHLIEEIGELEKSKTVFHQSLFSLGIKTPEERVAFNYVKTAKNYAVKGDIENARKNFEQASRMGPKFAYALGAYARFDFDLGHREHALSLSEQAVIADPQNFHPWMTRGILLKRSRRYAEARDCLLRARELNPNYLPIHNELGNVYTRLGEYQQAHDEFLLALKEEKYPNYRHKTITYMFMANNYSNWADSFRGRGDHDRQLEMLQKSLEVAQTGIGIGRRDRRMWSEYRRACRDLGIALTFAKSFGDGQPYLEKSIQTFQVGNVTLAPDWEDEAAGCFYMAALMMKQPSHDVHQVEEYIGRGQFRCPPGSKWSEKLAGLRAELTGTKGKIPEGQARRTGKIKFFHTTRKFGIIECGDETFLFVPSRFRERLPPETLYSLDGRAVSFLIGKDYKRGGRLVAVDIELLDS